MFCVEDYLSVLEWADANGALGNGLIQKSMHNLNAIKKFL